ncbi:MAG: hypothetical protein P8012_10665 [Desulfobacterales bacterium]
MIKQHPKFYGRYQHQHRYKEAVPKDSPFKPENVALTPGITEDLLDLY